MNLVSVRTVEDQYPIAKMLTLATTQQPENMEQLPVLRALLLFALMNIAAILVFSCQMEMSHVSV